MAPKVIRWASKALLDITEVLNYVAQNNPQRADVLAEEIERSVTALLENPYIGRKIPEYNQEHLRERIVKTIRVLYRITPEQIEVLGVFPSNNKLPRSL